MSSEPAAVVWGIHAGRTGDAHSFFMSRNVVALGWPRVADLGKLPPTRDAFKDEIARTHPEMKPGAVPVSAGQLFRFKNELALGDLVAYPSKTDRQIQMARVTGDYAYDPQTEPSYPHTRSVSWLASAPRTRLSQGALYEIGSALSFFQIKNYADEFVAIVEGRALAPEATLDEAVTPTPAEFEEVTRDFVLKQLSKELKGHPFAEFVANLLGLMGYRTRVAPEGPDGGVDVLAHRDELGFEPPIIKVQVKSGEATVGDPVVSALYGKVAHEEFGLIVTLGSFSPQARSFAGGKGNLRLIDGEGLVDLVFHHYEQLDSRYKRLLPLTRIYVPEPPEVPEQIPE